MRPLEQLELHNRLFVLPKRQRRWMRAATWGLAAAPIGVIVVALLLLAPEAIDWSRIADKVKESVARNPWDAISTLIAGVAGIAQIGYVLLAVRRERLILTPAEIRYQSPLPRALQFLQPSWSLRWSELTRASVAQNRWLRGPLSAVLTLVTIHGERKINPYQWVDPETFQPESAWQAMRKGSAMSVEAAMESPVMRFAAARYPQLELKGDWAQGKARYALEKNSRALALAAVFVVLVVYAIADTAIGSETYAGAPPYFLCMAAGMLVAGLSWIWLRGGAVPVPERAFVALFVGAALGAALYPGLLRLNQLTDREGLQSYRYTLEADLSLTPLEPGLPALRFMRDFDYWMQFPRGSIHTFRLRRGALGFYQIDLAPLHEDLRRFYWKDK